MANFPQHTSNRQLSKVGEYSPLRSPKDKDSPYQSRKIFNQYADQINILTQNVKQLYRESQRKNDPNVKRLQDFGFFPFQIYTIPDIFRPQNSGSYTSGSNWTTVRVRNGQVLTSFVNYSSSFVYGTDGVQYPDSNYFNPSWTANVDYIIPSGSNQQWFWIEELSSSVSGSNYIVQSSTSSNVSSTYVQSPWFNYPSASNNHIPIGVVDAVSSASIHQLLIRQFLRTDVMSTGGTTSGSYIQLIACSIDGVNSTIFVLGYISGSH